MTFLMILFWLLFIFWAIGVFAPLAAPWNKATTVVLLILVGILGYMVFGNPVHH